MFICSALICSDKLNMHQFLSAPWCFMHPPLRLQNSKLDFTLKNVTPVFVVARKTTAVTSLTTAVLCDLRQQEHKNRTNGAAHIFCEFSTACVTLLLDPYRAFKVQHRFRDMLSKQVLPSEVRTFRLSAYG